MAAPQARPRNLRLPEDVERLETPVFKVLVRIGFFRGVSGWELRSYFWRAYREPHVKERSIQLSNRYLRNIK
jgi:hypothetical protein